MIFLRRIHNKLDRIITKMAAIDDNITKLQADVSAENTVIDSAVALINGFASQLAAAVSAAQSAGATPAQLQSLTDLSTSIESKTQALATAVASGTPVAK